LSTLSLTICVKDPSKTDQIGTIHFPFYTLSEQGSWISDPHVSYKQFVAKVIREAEARYSVADFYNIFNEPGLPRLTPLEERLGVLYASDGEFSAFTLGCILRLVPRCLSTLKNASDPWNKMLPMDFSDSRNLKTDPRNLKDLFNEIRVSFPEESDILPMQCSLLVMFQTLGLLTKQLAPTERLAMLARWLHGTINHNEVSERLFGTNWIDIGDANIRTTQLESFSALINKSSEQPPKFEAVLPLLEVLLSNGEPAERFGRRSRVGYENLFAHLVWRRDSSHARSWVVIPLREYALSNDEQQTQVAFFLGTVKDTDSEGTGLSEESLNLRFDGIRQCAFAASKDFEKVFLKRAVQPKVAAFSREQKVEAEQIQERFSVCTSTAFERVRQLVDAVAGSDVGVLITGESGTGKELVANMLHFKSTRSGCPFVAQNCANLNPQLADSLLFGHVKGSFTDAKTDAKGKFEVADTGTLFLDEIGDLPFESQGKLLRALQEGEIEKVGSEKPIPVDVRVIVATHWNLTEAIDEGSFRDDLYYRIKKVIIDIPPLRVRKEDIGPLIDYFLAFYSREYSKQVKPLSKTTVNLLTEYEWPGNVRELESLIEILVLLMDDQASEIDIERQDQFSQILSTVRPAKPTGDGRKDWPKVLNELAEINERISGKKTEKLPSSAHFGKRVSRAEIAVPLCGGCKLAEGYVDRIAEGLNSTKHSVVAWFGKCDVDIGGMSRLPCVDDPARCVNKQV
jgi:DNA-binding NtrC family response regulator